MKVKEFGGAVSISRIFLVSKTSGHPAYDVAFRICNCSPRLTF
ncbi:unnamed protein product [Amoebophrya sp. A25]|nr:unnamed protein product [Amoebophrya sp. A25]|eukprot:GSA25T00004349001.1